MTREPLLREEVTGSVIGAFFEVYNTLGFGFLEHLYVMALERELRARGHRVSREVYVPVSYKGDLLGKQRLDMIVDDAVVVETKSTYELHRAATRQVYNYLRATALEVGLVLHFGPTPKFYRIVGPQSRRSDGDPERSGSPGCS
ncbi:MAG TPA: GxxExxY protein [Gemmatimonadaceae bacterium]|nr:GxxExxY protein [Gemmatimonadaceae bacterium]